MSIFKHLLGVSVSALAILPAMPAFAQSTGTQTFEQQDIVVTAAQNKADQTVGGVGVSDTPKARRTLDQDFIGRQVAGQTVDDIINYIPGVSFQNNDPYGIDGGTLTIHGFSAQFISQTFDGIPQNDSGNYQLYPQDQVDPELIQRVDVTLGSTDIDSPTASATGSTVNYITRNPTEDFHVRLEGSAGQFDFMRIFGVVDTGDFTKYGTRAWIAGSFQSATDPYDADANQNKEQFNAKIYQPIGTNGDFISVAGWYDRDRGNRFNDVFLQTTPGGLPASRDLIPNAPAPCQTAPARSGVKDTANSCGSSSSNFGLGYRPSDNANIRANSRFTLAPGLVLTVDPSYNYVKANGSSEVAATEGFDTAIKGDPKAFGYIGGKPFFGGVDLNGDGDTLDTVGVAPASTTVTNRFIVISNLIYKITPTQTVRFNYTFDHAKLRQTGEVGLLQIDGKPALIYPSDSPLLDATGKPIESRNRTSFSILNQVAGEYRGEFFDDRLVLTGGVRAPFFKRDLNNFCVTEATGNGIGGGNGFVDCFNDPASQAAFLAANPADQAPQQRHRDYNRVLPSAGFTYNVTRAASVFFDYSEGLQVPSTDDLYDGFAYPASSSLANAKPQQSFNFEGGLRYKSPKIQAEVSGWNTVLHNAISESFAADPQSPTLFEPTFFDIGTVHRYGVDASVAYKPIRALTFYVFGSYLHDKILNNVELGLCSASNIKFGDPAGNGSSCSATNNELIAATAGKMEAGLPKYMIGGRVQGNLGPVSVGMQAKYTGARFANEQDTPFFNHPTADGAGVPGDQVAFPAKAAGYTLVDLDARLALGFLGLNDSTYLQLNVHNLFDKFYIGGFSGQTLTNNVSTSPFVYIGTPRTISGTVNFAF
jgi:iron complex outermembrane receptor protein